MLLLALVILDFGRLVGVWLRGREHVFVLGTGFPLNAEQFVGAIGRAFQSTGPLFVRTSDGESLECSVLFK